MAHSKKKPRIGEVSFDRGKFWEVVSVQPVLTPYKKANQTTGLMGWTTCLKEKSLQCSWKFSVNEVVLNKDRPGTVLSQHGTQGPWYWVMFSTGKEWHCEVSLTKPSAMRLKSIVGASERYWEQLQLDVDIRNGLHSKIARLHEKIAELQVQPKLNWFGKLMQQLKGILFHE